MIVGIHHTALSTDQLDRLVAFYRDLFGFEAEFEFPWDEQNTNFQKTHGEHETAGRVAMLTREGARLEIFEYRKPEGRAVDGLPGHADRGLCHFCFEVKEIEAEFERLKAAGMPFVSPPVPQANIKCCYGRDPDGNLIELIEYFDEIVEGTG